MLSRSKGVLIRVVLNFLEYRKSHTLLCCLRDKHPLSLDECMLSRSKGILIQDVFIRALLNFLSIRKHTWSLLSEG